MVARSAHSQRQRKFVSLYDYDPFTMGKTGRPEQQLSLRKGDVITVIGDIDIDGYYTAELNGMLPLILSKPSFCVKNNQVYQIVCARNFN